MWCMSMLELPETPISHLFTDADFYALGFLILLTLFNGI